MCNHCHLSGYTHILIVNLTSYIDDCILEQSPIRSKLTFINTNVLKISIPSVAAVYNGYTVIPRMYIHVKQRAMICKSEQSRRCFEYFVIGDLTLKYPALIKYRLVRFRTASLVLY